MHTIDIKDTQVVTGGTDTAFSSFIESFFKTGLLKPLKNITVNSYKDLLKANDVDVDELIKNQSLSSDLYLVFYYYSPIAVIGTLYDIPSLAKSN